MVIGKDETHDFVFTRDPSVILGTLVADCLAISFTHEQSLFAAHLHAGYRHVCWEYPFQAVELIKGMGINVQEQAPDGTYLFRVHMSPANHWATFDSLEPIIGLPMDEYICKTGDTSLPFAANWTEYALDQLIKAGLVREQITFDDRVTTHPENNLFSHRAHTLDTETIVKGRGLAITAFV
jgi:copper oxidase (laccase) domain-containing protein